VEFVAAIPAVSVPVGEHVIRTQLSQSNTWGYVFGAVVLGAVLLSLAAWRIRRRRKLDAGEAR